MNKNSKTINQSYDNIIQDFNKFTSGILGDYEGCIVTEIFGAALNQPTLILYVLITFLDKSATLADISCKYASEFLNKSRIKITDKNFDGYTFGIKEYIFNCDEALIAFNRLINNKTWSSNDQSKYTNHLDLEVISSKFVMVDDNNGIAINNILRNNFFNGSYIIEFFDCKKTLFKPFFDNQILLDKLSQEFIKYTSIDLAPVPDKLGSIIFQFPVIKNNFQIQNISNDVIQVDATSNIDNLTAIITSNNDEYGVIDNYNLKNLSTSDDQIYVGNIDKIQPIIYDTQNNLIIYAKATTYYLHSTNISLNLRGSEPTKIRKFNNVEIPLVALTLNHNFTIGSPKDILASSLKWRKQRNYIENTKKIIDNLEFKQFHPGEITDAIKFIHSIINKYGQKEVYLWDPYCTTTEIINTIFHTLYQNVIIKIMTSKNAFGKCKV